MKFRVFNFAILKPLWVCGVNNKKQVVFFSASFVFGLPLLVVNSVIMWFLHFLKAKLSRKFMHGAIGFYKP